MEALIFMMVILALFGIVYPCMMIIVWAFMRLIGLKVKFWDFMRDI